MPRYNWVDGNVPTAATLNANVRDQVIEQCTSATRPTPATGQLIFETDTGLYQYYNGSAWIGFGPKWQSYTTTMAQSTAVTFTTSYCRYFVQGRTVMVSAYLNVTSAGTANNAVVVGSPLTPSFTSGTLPIGSGAILDASDSSNYYPVFVVTEPGGNFKFLDATAKSAVYAGQTGSAFSAALANGDVITFSCTYEGSW